MVITFLFFFAINSQGVSASHEMAKRDRPYVDKYKGRITNAGQKYGVDPAVLGGVISRVQGWDRTGQWLRRQCKCPWATTGNINICVRMNVRLWIRETSFVDKRCHRPQGAWDSQEHIEQGAQILAGFYSDVEKKYPHWTKEQKLKGALAAYNMGPGSISSYEQVDAKTTGGDYSNQIKCIYKALLTSADISKCCTETQPKTSNSKQCRCRSTVARKNSLERPDSRKKPREEPGYEGWLVLFWLCRMEIITEHGQDVQR
ncbi:lysozyme g-like [Salvelinus alpinus]|uniref:lysozyme g-like n=1 Tax=Salvelinus alpinus TaxID=8036 RepID=UPI0039FDC7DA